MKKILQILFLELGKAKVINASLWIGRLVFKVAKALIWGRQILCLNKRISYYGILFLFISKLKFV